MTLKRVILLTLFIIFCTAPWVYSEMQISVKKYPMPITEISQVISDWFVLSGYTVQNRKDDVDCIILHAIKENRTWQILLTPYSSLASKVTVNCLSGDANDETELVELWEYLSRYIKSPSSISDHSEQAIPTVILSQIDTVVCIRVEVKDNPLQFSGFFVDSEGLVLCTAHDLKRSQEMKIILYDGRELTGKVLKIDFDRDLAILHVNAKIEKFISVSKGRNLLGMGEIIYSVGCPINLRGSIYPGIINGPPRRLNNLTLWQVKMDILPGSSGSPIFDQRGTLVAMIKGRHRETGSVGFLIPLETMIEFINEK